MDIVVTPFDVADDAAAERAYEIESATRAADEPDHPPLCRQRFVGGMRHPMPGDQPHCALAHLGGIPVGYLAISLPQLENRDNSWIVSLAVHPEHRRRGAGRALYEYAVRLVRDQGRKRLIGETISTPPGAAQTGPGDAFAAAMGAHAALADVRRRLDVTALDQAGLDRLLDAARARADGYSLVRWTGRTPDEYADDVAYLDSRLTEDAPLGDLTWEPPKPDVTRLRGVEAALTARRNRSYHSGMRHDATGRLVAWTMLAFAATSAWHAFQQITLVEPRHRGHRLGTIVKIENLRYALVHEPELRVIDTYNAAVNDHMISINEAMGFRVVGGLNSWQLAV